MLANKMMNTYTILNKKFVNNKKKIKKVSD